MDSEPSAVQDLFGRYLAWLFNPTNAMYPATLRLYVAALYRIIVTVKAGALGRVSVKWLSAAQYRSF